MPPVRRRPAGVRPASPRAPQEKQAAPKRNVVKTATPAAKPARNEPPAWLDGAVVYGVVPPLFGGQPLKSVTAKLDYLKEMGFDAIWLSPVNKTDDPSAISYGVTDYQGVREDFGSKKDFKRLVDEAHRRGLKVLMDFVPNHTSAEHPFFKDALAKGKDSKYWDYYVRDARGNPQNYFDWEALKNLNYDHPGVQQMMTDAFTYWVREMGVDGFRVDAAWGVKERNPEFWSKLERAVSELKPDVFLLAEASARDPYYVKNGFDAAYDWTKELGHWAWEKVFEDPSLVGERLRQALAGRETPPDKIARFLNNNDTGERFITRYGVDTQRVAAVLLHTLPGIPVVYTGDEVGAEFQPYEDPPAISWEDPHQLRPLYKKLAELRETLPALRSGTWTEVKVKDNPAAYAFVRDAGQRGQALVVLNFGKAARIELEGVDRKLLGSALRDALTGKPVAAEARRGTLALDLKKSSAVVLCPE